MTNGEKVAAEKMLQERLADLSRANKAAGSHEDRVGVAEGLLVLIDDLQSHLRLVQEAVSDAEKGGSPG